MPAVRRTRTRAKRAELPVYSNVVHDTSVHLASLLQDDVESLQLLLRLRHYCMFHNEDQLLFRECTEDVVTRVRQGKRFDPCEVQDALHDVTLVQSDVVACPSLERFFWMVAAVCAGDVA